jgi:hypothetical protein
MKFKYFLMSALIVLTVSARAAIPPLSPIPDSVVGKLREDLESRRAEIDNNLTKLNQDEVDFNAKCGNRDFKVGDPAIQECLAAQSQIVQEKQSCVQEVAAFNTDVRSYVSTAPAQEDPTSADLAKDPELARITRVRLDQINSRIERLQKAIDILGDSNPEWAKEWQNLHKDQIESTHQLMWNSLDLLTIGLAEGYKYATEAQLNKAREVFQGQDFSELMHQKESLLRMRKMFVDTPAFDNWINDLNGVEEAAGRNETANAIAKVRDSISTGVEVYHEAKTAAASDDAMEQLYHGSTALGGVAVALVGGVGAKVALPAAAGFKLVEAGLTIKLIREEDQQFTALSTQAYERNQKKLELMKKKDDLENQASELKNVLQRSEGLK